LNEQTVRGYVTAFLLQGLDSLRYRRHPADGQLTQTQRRELAALLRAGPRRPAMHGLLDHPVDPGRDPTALWCHLSPATTCVNSWIAWGSRSRKRVLSPITSMKPAAAHGNSTPGPRSGAWAHQQDALILFGDEASFGQWGSLSYTWAPKGQQTDRQDQRSPQAYKSSA